MWDRRYFFLAYDYIDDWQDVAASESWEVIPYVLDWKAIAVHGRVLEMPDPFATYEQEAERFGRVWKTSLKTRRLTEQRAHYAPVVLRLGLHSALGTSGNALLNRLG